MFRYQKSKNVKISIIHILGLLNICLLVFAMLGCSSKNNIPKTADEYVQEYGGNPDVYNRILNMTDCAALQAEFDQADANLQLQQPGTPQYKAGLGYMEAADTRMREIGCYGQ